MLAEDFGNSRTLTIQVVCKIGELRDHEHANLSKLYVAELKDVTKKRSMKLLPGAKKKDILRNLVEQKCFTCICYSNMFASLPPFANFYVYQIARCYSPFFLFD